MGSCAFSARIGTLLLLVAVFLLQMMLARGFHLNKSFAKRTNAKHLFMTGGALKSPTGLDKELIHEKYDKLHSTKIEEVISLLELFITPSSHTHTYTSHTPHIYV